jgi:GH18 family chitinase
VTTIQKKTNLALDNGFGGMMLWELGHDAEGSHSLTGVISQVLEKGNAKQKQVTINSNDEESK